MKGIGTQEIRTARLLLRRFREGDAAAVYENYGSDPAVNRYISFAPCAAREGAEEFVRMHLERYDSDPGFYAWAIELGGEVVGSVGLFNADEHACSCELGYSLGSAWWGKGYATEGLRLALDEARKIVPEDEIYLRVLKSNPASLRVMRKCGGYIHHEDDKHYFVRVKK